MWYGDCNECTLFGQMHFFFLLLQPLLLSGKGHQNMQQQGVSYIQCTKSEGRDWHQIVGFSVELLEEVETLAPSCLLTGVHKFPWHDNVVVQTFSHLQALISIKLVGFRLKREKRVVSVIMQLVKQCIRVHTTFIGVGCTSVVIYLSQSTTLPSDFQKFPCWSLWKCWKNSSHSSLCTAASSCMWLRPHTRMAMSSSEMDSCRYE